MYKCDGCGQDVQIGDWPWCPHGRGDHLVSHTYWDHTLRAEVNTGPGGIRAKLMKERHLEHMSPRRGMPGQEI